MVEGNPTTTEGVRRREALAAIAATTGGLVGLAGTAMAAPGATVTGSNGNYETTSGGSTVYSGGDLAAAIRSGIEALPDGRSSRSRVLVEASGEISSQIWIPSYTSLDLQETVWASGIIPFYADQVESISIENLTLEGSPSMGMRIRRSADIELGTITMNIDSGIGIRIDDAHNDGGSEWTQDVRIDTVDITGAASHAVETYGVDGFTANRVTATDVGGCGLLLNTTKNAEVGLVDATRANEGGGYAGFRCANDAGPSIHVERVESRSCGRGIFTVSGSQGITIDEVYLEGNSGNLIQDSRDVTIRSGEITETGSSGVRIDSRSSDRHPHTRNVTITGCDINNNDGYGVYETGPGTEENRIEGNGFCSNGDGATSIYADSTVVTGNNYDCSGVPGGTPTTTTPCQPTAITPYLHVDGGSWQETATVTIESGQTVEFGPHPTEGGSWSWSGPNLSASTREVTVSPTETSTYTATYTNSCGVDSTMEFTVTVESTPTETTNPTPGGPPAIDGTVPQDLDGDGTYGDFNANGQIDFPDVNTFFQNSDTSTVQDNAEFFDFTGEGQISLQDVMALFGRV
ncbi:MAG: right-handed parallel beta-helix repeat-containing protein [Halococcoides sp.]